MNWKKGLFIFLRYSCLAILAFFLMWFLADPITEIYKKIFNISDSGLFGGFLPISIGLILWPFFTVLLFLFIGEKRFKYSAVLVFFGTLFFLYSHKIFDIAFILTFLIIPSAISLVFWLLIQGIKKLFKKKNNKTQI